MRCPFVCSAIALCCCVWSGIAAEDPPVARDTPEAIAAPEFQDCVVHDPSVIKVGDTYWIFGSHLAAAKSTDLMRWTQVSRAVRDGNPLIPHVSQELAETFKWSTRFDLWAPCVTQLGDGKFYMYYCSCEGRSPLSALGVAVADRVEGPYRNLQILLRSGRGTSEDGTPFDVRVHPNAIDPHTFFDAESNLWMVYGSFSGGIFILKMDPKSGVQLPGQGHGKKLLGGQCQVEGAFIQYSPHTGYYYLFVSFGSLDSRGGYNFRVARSRTPDGPYLDPQGHDMIDCNGYRGGGRAAIESYGAKLVGNFRFLDEQGNPLGTGYVSPGHNSTCYDRGLDKYFAIFHTRFPRRGEGFQVRVHQMFLNEDGWFVLAPHRYAGETIGPCDAGSLCGTYAYIDHGSDISANVKDSSVVALNSDGTITGAVTGRWEPSGVCGIRITTDETAYSGVVLRQWDSGLARPTVAISALSSRGTAIWATQLSRSPRRVDR